MEHRLAKVGSALPAGAGASGNGACSAGHARVLEQDRRLLDERAARKR